ncbi:MAG: hypothetical protein LBU21_07530, partial [Treponema sp.]|nr:hypothetical protein [Treponema sp.]
RIEAVNSYDRWLQNNNEDPRVRYEYAQVLEQGEYYARALEEYRKVLEGTPASAGGSASGDAGGTGTGEELTRYTVRYAIARLLLIADAESEEGITELRTAVSEGFQDTAALETLLEDPAVPELRKDDIRTILVEIADAKEAAAREEAEKGGGDTPEEGASEASPGLEPEIPPEGNRSAETGETPP